MQRAASEGFSRLFGQSARPSVDIHREQSDSVTAAVITETFMTDEIELPEPTVVDDSESVSGMVFSPPCSLNNGFQLPKH